MEVADAAGASVSVSWVDTFADELGYRVERRPADDAAAPWREVTTVAAADGADSHLSWSGAGASPGDAIRVVALKADYVVPLRTIAGAESVTVPKFVVPPTIVVGMAEPLKGVVPVSVSGGASFQHVAYSVDLQTIATSDSGPAFAVEWDSQRGSWTNAPHVLAARGQLTADTFVELRRQIALQNPDLRVTITPRSAACSSDSACEESSTSGSIHVDVAVTAPIGIRAVELYVDGASLGALVSPNAPGLFRWAIDTRTYAPGAHVLEALAVDRNGDDMKARLPVSWDQPPALALDTPAPATVASGHLRISGTFSDDTPGVQVTVTLGDVPVLTTTRSPFSIDYDLKDVAPGAYVLTAVASDAAHQLSTRRTVYVESGTPFSFTRVVDGVACEGTDPCLVAAGDGQLLFLSWDLTAHLWSVADGSERLLDDAMAKQPAGPKLQKPTWRLSHGHAAREAWAGGGYADAPLHVFVYASDGTRRDLSAEIGSTAKYDDAPVLRWPWIAWNSRSKPGDVDNASNTYELLNLDSGRRATVPQAPGDAYSYTAFTLAVTDSAATLVYASSPTDAGADLLAFDVESGQVRHLTGAGGDTRDMRTDGVRVAWRTGADGPTYDLHVASLAAPDDATSLTTLARAYDLADGVLAWLESDGVTTTLKADDGQPVTLSNDSDAVLLSVAGGHVAFQEQGKLFVWDRSHGRRKVLDAPPRGALVDGDSLYFGVEGAIYAVDLR